MPEEIKYCSPVRITISIDGDEPYYVCGSNKQQTTNDILI